MQKQIHVSRSLVVLFLTLPTLFLGCTSLEEAPQSSLEEDLVSVSGDNPETDSPPSVSSLPEVLEPIPLDKEEATNVIDIRGVGDSGMAVTHQQPLLKTQNLPEGVPADFGKRLDALDPTGKSYQGDLSFINWESTVGNRCNGFWAPLGKASFAFVSHPDNLVAAYERGFNLVGLANNHTRDCPQGEEGVDGAQVSAQYMGSISKEINPDWLWHGVGQDKTAQVKTFNFNGQEVKVAFVSMYIALGDCTYVTCLKDRETVLESLRDADADLKILAMHSWNAETQQQLIEIGQDFLKNYDGDIVFGHGPHTWKPVRVVESSDGKKGVMFESLGNFLHPSLLPSQNNIIGRVLIDPSNFEIRQVQAIPVATNRTFANFAQAPDPTTLTSDVPWQLISDPNWQSGISSVKGAYFNLD